MVTAPSPSNSQRPQLILKSCPSIIIRLLTMADLVALQPGAYAAVWISFCLGSIISLLRIYSRAFVVRNWGWDDWCAVVIFVRNNPTSSSRVYIRTCPQLRQTRSYSYLNNMFSNPGSIWAVGGKSSTYPSSKYLD